MNDARGMPRSGLDTCWHVPVISALAIVVVSIGFGNSGFFFVGFMEELHCNRAAATWPNTLLSMGIGISGIAVWVLQRWFSIFHIAQAASALSWIGMMASAFAPDMPWMIVTFGVIHGALRDRQNIWDLKRLPEGHLITFYMLALEWECLHLPHMTSFSYLVPACLLAATLIGCVTSMVTVLMADYLGVDAISLCWVGEGVASLPLYLSSSTILGCFRDFMGSYDNFYRLLAGTQLFVGLMFFLVCCYENRKVSIHKSTYTVNR
ncbi:monocarboxylate transporter 12 [Ixodes scapularis]